MSLTSIEWALAILKNLGYKTQNLRPETVLNTPWSCVYRFVTDHGNYYLKQVPPPLALEADVIQILQKTGAARVPILIANNPQKHCFLMEDAGVPLREFFKQSFDANILISAVHDYINLQRKTIDHLPIFIDIGITDWRLQKLPCCYQELIEHEALLLADDLTGIEINQLSKLTPRFTSLCEQLSAYPIPETFSHSDFSDKNILIYPETKQMTLVDLGEVEITHPFFSIFNLLDSVKEYYRLKDDAYQWLQRQVLHPWLDLVSEQQLLEMVSLVQQCWSVHRALTVYRLLIHLDALAAKLLLGKGRLAKRLRYWLEQCAK